VISPPSIYLLVLQESVKNGVQVAAQNAYFKESGAFTGEIRYPISLVDLLGEKLDKTHTDEQSSAVEGRRYQLGHFGSLGTQTILRREL
jgi:Triosephosphate isomerase